MFGGISIWQLLILLAIVALVFGTKKLSTFGSDLGGAIKGFKKAMSDDEKAASTEETATSTNKVAESGAQLKDGQVSQPSDVNKTNS